jgi:ABC-type taurine transport system substrate-binding protein
MGSDSGGNIVIAVFAVSVQIGAITTSPTVETLADYTADEFLAFDAPTP